MMWCTGPKLGEVWSPVSKSMGSEWTCGCRLSERDGGISLCEQEGVGEGEKCVAGRGSLSVKSSVIEMRSPYQGRQDVKGLDKCLVTLLNLPPHAGQTSLFPRATLGIHKLETRRRRITEYQSEVQIQAPEEHSVGVIHYLSHIMILLLATL